MPCSGAKIACKICGKEYENIARHVQESHSIAAEGYYDKYVGRPRYCPTCGKKAKFISITKGYKRYCSNRCEQIAKGVDVESDSYKKKHHCLICDSEVDVLYTHLRSQHKMSTKDYYDQYYKKSDEGVCPVCGKETGFVSKHLRYQHYCSISCMNNSEQHKKQVKQTCLERYGGHPLSDPEVRKKCEATCLERYGVTNPSKNEEVKAKKRATSLENYGCEHPSQSKEFRDQVRDTCLKKYGVENVFQCGEVKAKKRATNLEHWGCENVFQSESIKKKIRETIVECYGVENISCSEEIKEKKRQAYIESYGADHPMHVAEIKDKVKKTKTENGTWNTSSAEEELHSTLVDIFGEGGTIRQYKEERYNYRCDFYIPSRDLFIELNAYASHMGRWFDEDDPEEVAELKRLEDSDNGYDNMCAKGWLGDAKKRETARQNNLNYVVFWRKEDFDLWVSLGCPDGKDYIKEYSWLPVRKTLDPFCEFPKKLSSGTSICRAVAKAANGDSLFHRECKMWEENPPHKGTFLQPWLYANRLKYMNSHKNPEEISDAELIRGFTISGTIRGYSRYDAKPMKELLEEYKVKSVYDPCAGWGERLALCGALDISYEGVDINEKVVNGHNKIISYYKLGENYSSTCDDSAKYTPKGSPDAVFTCPPYLAKEIYTDKGAENLSPEEFEEWWKEVCSNFPDSVQYVFIHIDEETKPHIIAATEANGWKLIGDRYFSKKNASHFNRGKGGEIKKKNWESVLIFKRQ